MQGGIHPASQLGYDLFVTLVAAASLFRGVILLSDCRATLSAPGRPDSHADCIQKCFPLTDHAAIGFAGDKLAAEHLLLGILGETRKKRMSSEELADWLPAYLKAEYGSWCTKAPLRDVAFIVASIEPAYHNLIPMENVKKIVDMIFNGTLSVQRSFFPGILAKCLQAPPGTGAIEDRDSPLNLVYSMHSPDFVAVPVRTLESVVIGSGSSAREALDKARDWLFAWEVGNPAMESMVFRRLVMDHVRDRKMQDVGGLFPCLSITAKGMQAWSHTAEIPEGGEKIVLDFKDGRWFQVNHTKKKTVPILPPWEVDVAAIEGSQKFDDLRDALDGFDRGGT